MIHEVILLTAFVCVAIGFILGDWYGEHKTEHRKANDAMRLGGLVLDGKVFLAAFVRDVDDFAEEDADHVRRARLAHKDMMDRLAKEVPVALGRGQE